MRSERLRKVRWYLDSAEKYLAQAREYIFNREFEKASEALWGSISTSLNALAVLKVKPMTHHMELKNFAKQLSLELKEPDIYETFRCAEKLHANFYHGILDEEDIRAVFPKVEDTVRRVVLLVRSHFGEIP